MSDWYQLSADEVLEKLESDPEQGLTSAEAAKRLEQFGPNELVEKGAKSPWLILWDQMKEPMVIVLIVAAIVSILLREFEDAIIILAIVILNAVIGFSQEYRAEQAIAQEHGGSGALAFGAQSDAVGGGQGMGLHA